MSRVKGISLGLVILLAIVSITGAVGIGDKETITKDNGQTITRLGDTPWPMFRNNLNHTGMSPYNASYDNGGKKWNFSTGNDVCSSPAIDTDGTIYVGSYDNNLYALNPNGTKKWNFSTGDSVQSSPAIGSDGTIYVSSYDNNLYAINEDGTEKWNFSTGYAIWSSPAIGRDGTIYIGSGDDYLYAINPNGTEKWSFATGSYITSSPAIGPNGTIYIGSYDNNLYAVYPNGTEKWSFSTGDTVYSSPSIGNDGTIYVGSRDNNLYAINPNGTEKWRFTTGGVVDSSPAIGPNGVIYVGSKDNDLYAVDQNGTKKWNFTTGDGIPSSPAISSEGVVYIGSYDDYIYSIDPSGKEKWNYKTGDRIWSSPSISPNGTIYVGSMDDDIYALEDSTLSVPSAPRNLQCKNGDQYIDLTWDAPTDNGGSEITEYKIYRRTSSSNFIHHDSVGGDTTGYNDTNLSNGVTYYYKVSAVNKIGEGNKSQEAKGTPCLKYKIQLKTGIGADGWNFVSFKLVPLNDSLESILNDPETGIPYNYTAVMYYGRYGNKWKTYKENRSSHFDSLSKWNRTMGIWIKMTNNNTLTIEGTKPVMTNITLNPGWNMVGYPSSINQTANKTLPNEVTKIAVFDETEEYNINYVDDLTTVTMSPGNGYWLYNSESNPVIWSVDYQ